MGPLDTVSSPSGKIRVLGIDPGSIVTGWGVVESGRGLLTHLDSGAILLDQSLMLQERLGLLHDGVSQILRTYQPDEVAVERVFMARNADSALKLGHVRGVVLLAIYQAGYRAFEYAPAVVKKLVTGSGRAEKVQMVRMVQTLLRLDDPPCEDAADALAIAMAHIEEMRIRKMGLGK